MSVGSMVALTAERVVKPVEGMHRAISAPWFKAVGTIGRPVQVAHDVISGVVYGSIRLGAQAIGVAVDARGTKSSSAVPGRAAVNGLWGDSLGRLDRRLGTSMSLRDSHGAPVLPHADLGAAFPTATDHLVVLVHGLFKTEGCWDGSDARPGLIQSLKDHPALTPVTIRYNTGRRVAPN
ncbi:MAG: hypothetical protein KJN71_01190, partial [Acidimicrobiia bacterium]|nr:hypothetical protein [Acidimicrobiia bacterium]